MITINFSDRQGQIQFQATFNSTATGDLQSLTAKLQSPVAVGHPVDVQFIPTNEYEDMPWKIKFFNPLTGADMSIGPSYHAPHGIKVVEYERLVHPLQITALG